MELFRIYFMVIYEVYYLFPLLLTNSMIQPRFFVFDYIFKWRKYSIYSLPGRIFVCTSLFYHPYESLEVCT